MAKKKKESIPNENMMVRGRVILPKAYQERLEQAQKQKDMMKAALKPTSVACKDMKPTDFLNAFFWDDTLWKVIPLNVKKSYIFKVFQALSADTNMTIKMHQLQGCENIQTFEAVRKLYRNAYGAKRSIPQWAWTFWRKRTEERHPVSMLTNEQHNAICTHFDLEDSKYLRMFWDTNNTECEQFLKTV